MTAYLVLLAAGQNRRLGTAVPKALWTAPPSEPITPLAPRMLRQARAHNIGSFVVCRPEHQILFEALRETTVEPSPYAHGHPGSLASLLVGLEAAIRCSEPRPVVVADGDVAVSDDVWDVVAEAVRAEQSTLVVMPADGSLDDEAVGVYPGKSLTIAKRSELIAVPDQPVLGEATGIGVMSASDVALVARWARSKLDDAVAGGHPLTHETEEAWRWLAARGLEYSMLPASSAFIECDTRADMAALADMVTENRFAAQPPSSVSLSSHQNPFSP